MSNKQEKCHCNKEMGRQEEEPVYIHLSWCPFSPEIKSDIKLRPREIVGLLITALIVLWVLGLSLYTLIKL